MTQKNITSSALSQPASVGKRMLIGAGIGLLLISLFLSGVNHPNPAWGKWWIIKPLIMVPLAAAAGGYFSYLLTHLLGKNGKMKILIAILSVISYMVALWLGTVLGLNGTLWN